MTLPPDPAAPPAPAPVPVAPVAPAGAPAPAPAAAPTPPSPGQNIWQRLIARPDPLIGFALTLPVFLLYHLGLLLIAPRRSDADLITGAMLRLLAYSTSAYVIATCAIAFVLATIAWVQHKRGAAQYYSIARVLLESGAYAFGLLVTLGWATHRLASGVALSSPADLSPITKLVLACGTGFHEEILFRALFVTGGAVAFARLFKAPASVAVGLCVAISSLLFGLSQYVGAFSVTFTFDTLLYRTILGVAFAAIYLLRGFAMAVYAHVFYAALVFFVYA